MKVGTIGLLFVFASVTTFGSSQEEAVPKQVRRAQAVRAIEPPVVDGSIDDEVWAAAPPIGDFLQFEPFEGRPATERTEVRVLFDAANLYVGAKCYDSEPARIMVTESRRDSSLTDTDAFWMVFDTYHDRQNGFVFGTTPVGIEYDGQVTRQGDGTGSGGGGPGPAGTSTQSGSGGGFNLNWDGRWTVKTRLGEEGWSAEFKIPLTTLRFASGKEQVWGVNFARNIRRKNEQAFWSPVPRQWDLYRLSLAGELHGLQIKPPRNLKLIPYVVGSAQRDFENAPNQDTNYLGDAGFDVKYSITPSLTLDLTANTDFAQVEVDDQQVNLTRFNLFFPEKRPFFLENAGFFAVGKPQETELFFSRTIGIGAQGAPVPILGGARLSGTAGRWNIGLLDMQTAEQGLEPGANFAVARTSRQFGSRSSVGGVFVNKEVAGSGIASADYNRTVGVDARLGLGESFTATGFAARTSTFHAEGVTPEGGQYAYSAEAEYQSRTLLLWMSHAAVGESFNPEAGFLERKAYRSLDSGIFTYLRYPSVKWLREIRPHSSFITYYDLDGFKESEKIHLDTHVEWQNGTLFSPAVNITYEGLLESFEIYPGIFVPPGEYRNAEIAWRFNSDLSAPVSVDLGLDAGGFYTGNIRTYAAAVNGRAGAHFSASLRYVHNDVTLPLEGPRRQYGGDFSTNLVAARINYSFTPRLFVQSLLQYNDAGDNWSSNIRFGWLSSGGAGLFLVYNETRDLAAYDFGERIGFHGGPLSRAFFLKFSRELQLF